MRRVREGNFRNVKGNGGILLFIGHGFRHLKRHSQPESDTWHVPRRNELTLLVTNEVVTCDTSNQKHKHVCPRNDMGPHVSLNNPWTRGQLIVYYNTQLQTRPMLSSKANKANEINVDGLHYSILVHGEVVCPMKYLDDLPGF